MADEARESLHDAIREDPDVDQESVETDTDREGGIGKDVTRFVWKGDTACAVDREVPLVATCDALVAALQKDIEVAGALPDHDRSIHVLIDREHPSEVGVDEKSEAIRTVRKSIRARTARVWYRSQRGGERWSEDSAEPPGFDDDPRVQQWVETLMIPRLEGTPTQLARDFVSRIADPSMHLYPSGIKKGGKPKWAVRLDGLGVGHVDEEKGTLTIGSGEIEKAGPQRKVWLDVTQGRETVVFDRHGDSGRADLDEAVGLIRSLLTRWRHGAPEPGAMIRHRRDRHGRWVVDEHAIEARLLKGILSFEGTEHQLVLNDAEVARGSQFPTIWGHKGRRRSLDALVVVGGRPTAVELKVSSGGSGRSYRRSMTQAILYAHYIRGTQGLAPWFARAELNQSDLVAAIALPIKDRDKLKVLRELGSGVGVEVFVVKTDDTRRPV